jgi:ribosomal protein L11 methyltransferase
VGTLGVEVRDSTPEPGQLEVLAYWRDEPPPVKVPGARLVSQSVIAEEDWMAPFRRNAQPLEVGGRFWVDRGEEPAKEGVPPGRLGLRIPARTAFGTGSHESTRLLLEWLEDLSVVGRVVLDVGTGSGILALASLRLGAHRALAFDNDLEAVAVALENGRSNGLAPLLWAGTTESLESKVTADLVLVNVLPGAIRPHVPRICRHLSGGGSLFLSGILEREEAWALQPWKEAGLAVVGRRRDGDWAAYRLERP